MSLSAPKAAALDDMLEEGGNAGSELMPLAEALSETCWLTCLSDSVFSTWNSCPCGSCSA
ncbi:hypothetical protein [Escherichia coli]|uniref:hypothetical protein n=1 Tax=Escherichia coli TaxID=562 RepID=UPI0015B67FD5|nr:hypothetical protein [Escherichia coli]